MSTSFRVRFEQLLPVEELLHLELPDLRISRLEEAEQDGPGTFHVFREKLSTRATELAVGGGFLTVRVFSGACQEDWQLVRALLTRAATSSSGVVEEEGVGAVPVVRLDREFGPEWVDDRLDADATILAALYARAGPMRMRGPTREVVVGPRVLTELAADGAERPGARLVQLMRRVLWPDPRYESAAVFEVRPGSGPTWRAVALLVARACVVPVVDRLALNDATGMVIVIPWSALAHLPLTVTYVDDGNVLLEAVEPSAWPAVCAAARQFEIRP